VVDGCHNPPEKKSRTLLVPLAYLIHKTLGSKKRSYVKVQANTPRKFSSSEYTLDTIGNVSVNYTMSIVSRYVRKEWKET